jgi:3-isopropylmalate dehydratase small subunit
MAARILKDRRVAPGVVLKIVPATNRIWMQAQEEGLIGIFKKAGALVSNAGCAGCAAGQVGQNGPREIVVSTGNRNFPGKQGKGEVYLASPATVAASAVAGFLTTEDRIPDKPAEFSSAPDGEFTVPPRTGTEDRKTPDHASFQVEGRVWLVDRDDIDTDMIFHNRYLTITDIDEMGQYTFDNLEGYEDFARQVTPGDIVMTGKNFGAGSSRQQAVDCFKSLGVSLILARSFGAIYERNAINSAFPILTYDDLSGLELQDKDPLRIDLKSGQIKNLRNSRVANVSGFSEVQAEIYRRGGLLAG